MLTTLGYMENLKPNWGIGDTVSKDLKEKETATTTKS